MGRSSSKRWCNREQRAIWSPAVNADLDSFARKQHGFTWTDHIDRRIILFPGPSEGHSGNCPSLLAFFLSMTIEKQYAQPLLSAYMACIKHKPLEINLRDILRSLTFMIRFSPPLVWGESFHTSGLFPHFIHLLVDGEVNKPLFCDGAYNHDLFTVRDPSTKGSDLHPLQDFLGRSKAVPSADGIGSPDHAEAGSEIMGVYT
jgi:hypothetical protein